MSDNELMRERDDANKELAYCQADGSQLYARLKKIQSVYAKGPVYDWNNSDDGVIRLDQFIERLGDVINE